MLAGVAAFLWQADRSPLRHNAIWFATLLAMQWALGAAVQGRIGMGMALLIESAALATATSVLGLQEWHWLFKPLTMVIAIAVVAGHLRTAAPGNRLDRTEGRWLIAALAGSLAGDVFLMFGGFFIPGLVSFLLAHLCYIVLFRKGVPWFARRGALVVTLAIGVGMYAFLWLGGLPAALRGPVAAYVLVIALMAAQAIGRAAVLGGRGAWLVAIGAGFFMLSDATLATNRFVQPLPLAQLWVLATYYIAQVLIVAGMLDGARSQRRAPVTEEGPAASAALPPTGYATPRP